jgi:hypothetical protein
MLGVLRERYCNYHPPCAVSDRQSSRFNPVWTHLTNVELTMDSPSCIHLLKLGPDLSPLTISMQLIGVIPPVPPFMHTKIRSLCINYYDDDEQVNSASSSMHSRTLFLCVLEVIDQDSFTRTMADVNLSLARRQISSERSILPSFLP